MATALIIVAPLLKYAAGPLLGPALLAGAAERAGHRVDVLDLNIRFLREHLGAERIAEPVTVHGDHAKPRDALRVAAESFQQLVAPSVAGPVGHRQWNAALTLPLEHAAVYAAAESLFQGALGHWTRRQVEGAPGAPDMIGVSVLYSGQVLAGLVATMCARARWPDVPVVWGGPHVTALRDVIPWDPGFGRVIDGFVFGAADQTFVDLLAAVARGTPWPAEVVRPGSGGYIAARTRPDTLPTFRDVELYGDPVLTLPAQTGRGCAYGRCTYCTYPAIEGSVVDLGLEMLQAVVREAAPRDAVVSLKDSLLLPRRLEEVATCVAGRVRWAGCTKLHSRLDRDFMTRLAASGCRTLEFGLETLLPGSQSLIAKRQSEEVLVKVLDACAHSGVHPVINVITGFPGEDPRAASMMLAQVDAARVSAGGAGFGQVEHNTFELERLAPLAKDPRIEVVGSWPWASVMDWRWRC